MIQFNLLPEVKLQFIKAQRMRRLILSIAVAVSLLSLVLLGLVVGAHQLGKKHLSDLSRDISSESKKLQEEPQLNDILTVQNQLQSLTTLHAGKPAVARLFDYLNRLTPAQISLTNYTSDFTTQAVTVTGSADALSTVNQYIDTLKFTTYSLKEDTSTKTKAFKAVVLSSFSLSSATDKSKGANFGISFTYDPAIFDITKKLDLSVPSLISTRSNTAQPTSDLFSATPVVPVTPSTPSGGTR
jgi:hypothetical protein